MLAGFSHSYFTRDGRLYYMADRCDALMCYDNLDEEFAALLTRLGLPSVEVQKVNITPGKDGDYMSYYTEADVAIVEERFAEDLSLWRNLC